MLHWILTAIIISSALHTGCSISRSKEPVETATSATSGVAATLTDPPFYWGTATAAFQIEGAVAEDGRGPTIWDTFESVAGRIDNNDTAAVADDSYHKYEEDVALMKAMGVNSYRFSIAWTRILPSGRVNSSSSSTDSSSSSSGVNEEGIEYYNRLINLLLENGIEPFVTLFHWDVPQQLHDDYGGFLSERIVDDFVAYSDVCFSAFGDRVKHWITINEPWTVAYMAYELGVHAPGRCSDRTRCSSGNSSTESYIVAHNMLNAHAAAVARYRRDYHRYNNNNHNIYSNSNNNKSKDPVLANPRFPERQQQQGRIGITLNHDWAEPFTNSAADRAAAQRRNEFQLAWFADPIFFGKYPDSMIAAVGERLPQFTSEQSALLLGSIDFFGLNHYSSKYHADTSQLQQQQQQQRSTGWSADQQNIMTAYNPNGDIIGPQAESSWLHVVPWGFYNVILWTHERYMKPATTAAVPIYITENGCDVPKESELPLPQLLNDQFRIGYYSSYLAQLLRAIEAGVDVRGYFAWSLLDNFEWANGFEKRFGLHFVDFNSAERTRLPKASAAWYAQYIQQHPDPATTAVAVASTTTASPSSASTTSSSDRSSDGDSGSSSDSGDSSSGSSSSSNRQHKSTCLKRLKRAAAATATADVAAAVAVDSEPVECSWWDIWSGAVQSAAEAATPVVPFA